MNKWEFKSKTDSMIIYEQRESDECYNTAYFDLESKTLHVTMSEFIRNDDNKVITIEDLDYSAKYGYWKTTPSYLGLLDIRFLAMLAEHYFSKAGGLDDNM